VAGTRALSKLEFGEILCDTFGFDRKYIKRASVHDLKLKARRSNSMALSVKKFTGLIPGLLPTIEADLQKFADLKTK
jgi:dTDP-4-dehydrorhamnose reductase